MNSNQWVYHRLNKKTKEIEYSVDGINFKENLEDTYTIMKKKANIIEKKELEKVHNSKKDTKINIWKWYKHYEDLIKILYKDFIYISYNHGIDIKYNQNSFNDFCCMLYNESKNIHLLDKKYFDLLVN